MDFKTMSVEELRARVQEIGVLLEEEDADVDALTDEVRSIKEELASREATEAKKAELRKMVAEGRVPESKEIEKQEERKVTDVKEIRSSQEYAQAYLNMLKTRDDSEVRALLTTNTTAAGVTGYVPVPPAIVGYVISSCTSFFF